MRKQEVFSIESLLCEDLNEKRCNLSNTQAAVLA